jgi:hypothetical protein
MNLLLFLQCADEQIRPEQNDRVYAYVRSGMFVDMKFKEKSVYSCSQKEDMSTVLATLS